MQEMLDEDLRPPIALVEIDPPYGIDLQDVKKGEDRKNIGEYNEIDKDLYREFVDKTLEYVAKVTPKSCRILLWHGVEWYDTISQLLIAHKYDYDIIRHSGLQLRSNSLFQIVILARCYESSLLHGRETLRLYLRGEDRTFLNSIMNRIAASITELNDQSS